MTDRARLSDLGRRIDACIKHHGFTENELMLKRTEWLFSEARKSMYEAQRQRSFAHGEVQIWKAFEWRPA